MVFVLKCIVTFHDSHYSLMLALLGDRDARKEEILLEFVKNVSYKKVVIQRY